MFKKPNCPYCGYEGGPRNNLGCLLLLIGIVMGCGGVWFALKVMDGLTHGGIWK